MDCKNDTLSRIIYWISIAIGTHASNAVILSVSLLAWETTLASQVNEFMDFINNNSIILIILLIYIITLIIAVFYYY